MPTKLRLLPLFMLGAALPALAAPPAGERISFVSCPVVRDTRSVPCWLSDYQGDTYYLTIQSDVSADVQPPMLGHQVLVEGIVSDKPAICGGIVLDQVRLSVMPERDANCNTMLPAEDRYTIDFNPRPPGPSGGRLAFDPVPVVSNAPDPAQASGPQSFTLYFDFDKSVSFRHPGQLVTILERAKSLPLKRLRVTGMRGAHRLSNGTLLQESEGVARRRAEEVAKLLLGAGITTAAEVDWTDGSAEADGVDDWQSRRVTVVLEPETVVAYSDPGISTTLVLNSGVFAEGPYVVMAFVTHYPEADGSGNTYTSTHFEMFRLQDGLIAEHWDSLLFRAGQEVPDHGANQALPVRGSSGLAQYTQIHNDDPTLFMNKRLAFDLWRHIPESGREEMAELYLDPIYIQHNPNAATGREGFQVYFSMRPESDISITLEAPLVAMLAEGDLVVQVLETEREQGGVEYKVPWFDMYRIEGYRVIEHWDTASKGELPAVMQQGLVGE